MLNILEWNIFKIYFCTSTEKTEKMNDVLKSYSCLSNQCKLVLHLEESGLTVVEPN